MKIYILCPANRVTGGVELAHQLCYAINSLTDTEAYMWYMNIDNDENISVNDIVMNVSCPTDYEIYHTSCLKSVYEFSEMDSKDNVVVFPEGLAKSIELIDHAKKVLWWMSVDNYVGYKKEVEMPSDIILHLYQSFYAKNYVETNYPEAKGMYLSDYISEDHGKEIGSNEQRQNIAFYNPRKGFENLKPLMQKANWLEWVPLEGLTRNEMIKKLQTGKIYVDFGNHPGKDRIPREAAANGLCVITNKAGSAAFYGDVPIPDEYKFEDTAATVGEIDKLLHEICDNFDLHQKAFDTYRDVIANEKKGFDRDVITFVNILRRN